MARIQKTLLVAERLWMRAAEDVYSGLPVVTYYDAAESFGVPSFLSLRQVHESERHAALTLIRYDTPPVEMSETRDGALMPG
jgi:hypothetical protein